MDQSPPAVAVFGSSEPLPGSPPWREAYEVGRLLGEAGFDIINGGYGGVMEASARGVREAGGRAIGVTTAAFSRRPGANPWIETEHRERDLFDRTRRLIVDASAFVVLQGRSGTLAELLFLWALHKADLLGRKPIQLLGAAWDEFLGSLERLDLLDPVVLEVTEVARTPQAAVERLARLLGPARRGAGGPGRTSPG
jgi:uncharacterized protein (TIGR00725 family)